MDCLSIRKNDDLKCHQMEGTCAKGDNFLYGSDADNNEFDCFLQCLAFDNCRYYSWPVPSIDVHGRPNHECQFFSSCDTLIPDDQVHLNKTGSVTGFIDFDITKHL